MEKKTLIKALRLDNCFKTYNNSFKNQDTIFSKFEHVWGAAMANHFLTKYDDAESLIWALDSKNLKLFIEKF